MARSEGDVDPPVPRPAAAAAASEGVDLDDGLRLGPAVRAENATVWPVYSRRPADKVGQDLVLLDIMMPGLSGYDVCREIRRRGHATPILFVSAKSEEIDKVVGLELGADDFIVKPFGVREVVAHIRAVTRRCFAGRRPADLPPSFALGDLEISPSELRARRGDQVIELSLREVKILDLLARNRGKVLDRDTLFNHCWGVNFFPSSRTLDQHISKLRRRIELDPQNPAIIKTVHGVGYRWDG